MFEMNIFGVIGGKDTETKDTVKKQLKDAGGLKKCGYATEKKYAQILISVIEKYDLWVYDLPIFSR